MRLIRKWNWKPGSLFLTCPGLVRSETCDGPAGRLPIGCLRADYKGERGTRPLTPPPAQLLQGWLASRPWSCSGCCRCLDWTPSLVSVLSSRSSSASPSCPGDTHLARWALTLSTPVPLPSFPSQLGGGSPGLLSGGGSGGVRGEWGVGAIPGRQLPGDVGEGAPGTPGRYRVGRDVVPGCGCGSGRARWGRDSLPLVRGGSGSPPTRASLERGAGGGVRAGRSQRAGLGSANWWRQPVGLGAVAAGVCRPAGILRAWSFLQAPGRFTCLAVLFPKQGTKPEWGLFRWL